MNRGTLFRSPKAAGTPEAPARAFRRPLAACFKAIALLAMLGVLGAGLLLGSLWLEHGTAITLPTPTGPFAVGRAIYAWTDDGTPDTLAPVAGSRRELVVWIWYPAEAAQSAATMDD